MKKSFISAEPGVFEKLMFSSVSTVAAPCLIVSSPFLAVKRITIISWMSLICTAF